MRAGAVACAAGEEARGCSGEACSQPTKALNLMHGMKADPEAGGAGEEVLWGGLFALASLLREGSGAHTPVARAAAAAGLPALLRRCLAAYQAAAASRDGDMDDMIVQVTGAVSAGRMCDRLSLGLYGVRV